jgi:nucleoside-diphosphate-sugar epimerase
MRVLITGAGGNLGTKLRYYLSGAYELVLTSLHPRGDPSIQPADLSVWDKRWVGVFAGVDVVIHLAANPSPQAAWADLVPANVDMVLNVCEACVANDVGRLVFASSNHVMSGYRRNEVPRLRSDTPPCPGNPYGATKLIGERIGKNFSDRYGVSSINVRIGWNRRGRKHVPGPDMDDWGRKMWLSDRDYCQLMECCINAPSTLQWTIINGVSNNTGTKWDLSEARELVGYHPQDNAFDPRWTAR